MNTCRFLGLVVLLAVVSTNPALAQTAAKQETAATLVVWNRPILVMRAPVGQLSPRERVAAALQRIEALPDEALGLEVVAAPARIGNLEGYLVSVGPYLAFGVQTADLDPHGGETVEQAAQQAAAKLHAALLARAEQRSWPLLLRGLGLTVVATLLVCLVGWLAWRVHRRLANWLAAAPAHLERLHILEIDLRPQALLLERWLLALAAWSVSLGLLYLWLTFVLAQFPYTHPWGESLGAFLAATAARLAAGALAALPDLATVLIIALLARFLARLLSGLFLQVEQGRVVVSWLLPETARATRRLVMVVVWLFAATVAYPHIPGSDSEAFKGLSVLVGLMISLGSAGLVNQVMSGFVVLFSRAIRTGDYVRIGDVEGIVTELGTLSTKVQNLRKEEITIPNAVLVGTSTTNYSRLAGTDGGIVTTAVTIGYDTPWRQVHALLLLAAERTPGLRREPRPRVLQKALGDFYVEYVLLAGIDRPEQRLPVLSDLHAQIQDAFNEFGVQIMSPHFERQPADPVVVPPAKWHPAPAVWPDAASPALPSQDQEAGPAA